MFQATQQTYGRNRESLVGLTEQLDEIFRSQPTVKKTADGTLILPIGSMREVLRILFDQAGLAQLSDEDEASLDKIASADPGLELTPAALLEFVATLTANVSQERKASHFPRKSSPTNNAYILGARGRGYDRDGSGDSRSSSSDSLDRRHHDDPEETRHYGRPSPSPFDVRTRTGRRSGIEPPSSWSARRPVPASRRRKSDAGSNYGESDNEVSSEP